MQLPMLLVGLYFVGVGMEEAFGTPRKFWKLGYGVALVFLSVLPLPVPMLVLR